MSSPVKGVFAHLDCLVDGLAAVQKAGFEDISVMSPVPRHEIEEMIYQGRPSPVRWFTMVGAILGGACGFLLCSLTHLNWPMIIPAGKPLVSIPAFIVITFETTVLWGCMFTMLGLLVNCRLPALKLPEECQDPRFSDDMFGIVVEGLDEPQSARARQILTDAGAIEVSEAEVAHA